MIFSPHINKINTNSKHLMTHSRIIFKRVSILMNEPYPPMLGSCKKEIHMRTCYKWQQSKMLFNKVAKTLEYMHHRLERPKEGEKISHLWRIPQILTRFIRCISRMLQLIYSNKRYVKEVILSFIVLEIIQIVLATVYKPNLQVIQVLIIYFHIRTHRRIIQKVLVIIVENL